HAAREGPPPREARGPAPPRRAGGPLPRAPASGPSRGWRGCVRPPRGGWPRRAPAPHGPRLRGPRQRGTGRGGAPAPASPAPGPRLQPRRLDRPPAATRWCLPGRSPPVPAGAGPRPPAGAPPGGAPRPPATSHRTCRPARSSWGAPHGQADQRIQRLPLDEDGVVTVRAPHGGPAGLGAVGGQPVGEEIHLGRGEELVGVDVHAESEATEGFLRRPRRKGVQVVAVHRLELEQVGPGIEAAPQLLALVLEVALDGERPRWVGASSSTVVAGVERRLRTVGEHRQLACELEAAADVRGPARVEAEDLSGDVVPSGHP